MYYESHDYPDFSSDIQSIVASNVVVDSLDFEPGNNDYAVSYVKIAQTGGFDYRLEIVPPDQLQATVVNDGAESRIVTAVSFDASNQANVISYGWTGDTATCTTTHRKSASEIINQSKTLAADGYSLAPLAAVRQTALCRSECGVQGDTMARPISVTTTGLIGSSSFSTLPSQSPPTPPWLSPVGSSAPSPLPQARFTFRKNKAGGHAEIPQGGRVATSGCPSIRTKAPNLNPSSSSQPASACSPNPAASRFAAAHSAGTDTPPPPADAAMPEYPRRSSA